ncbi:hypothetical protein COLO4_29752 [Corchorus olitorius]|uniref:Uncharacterized protein n=1 Tax=Corchorus olitorius TaxID=93759 RepID=A0A1R3HDA8_9ROSI|nr:hypothetical protein COLO4_29752 [Corchorus olitorius]
MNFSTSSGKSPELDSLLNSYKDSSPNRVVQIVMFPPPPPFELKELEATLKDLHLKCWDLTLPCIPEADMMDLTDPFPSDKWVLIPRWHEGHGGGAKAENSKRKYWDSILATDHQKGENTKKVRQGTLIGRLDDEWVISNCEQPEEESVQQLLQKKTLEEVLEILNDRVDTRIEQEYYEASLDREIYKGWPLHIFAKYFKKIQMSYQEYPKLLPWLCIGETAATVVQGLEPWLIYDFDGISIEKEFIEQLFANNKKIVKFSDFHGLQEALLETPKGEIPKYLQDIASKFKKTWGTSKVENLLENILILLCAAVHEMQNHMGLKLLNWERLSIWGATYNKAKEAGFQVKFVEQHLNKILYAYVGFGLKKGYNIDPEERVRKLEDELKVIKECLSADKSFEGNPLSHGLFPL